MWSTAIQGFLEEVAAWAAGQADIQAVALVGSYARGAAREDSDIDLVILSDEAGKYIEDTGWANRFGAILRQQVEDYGKVTSLRVWYQDGPEVEYGFATADWAALPLDEGAHQVIADGLKVLWEKESHLEVLLEEHGRADRQYEALLESIHRYASPQKAAGNRRWFKNEDFKSHGLRAPDFRLVARPLRKPFQELSLAGRLHLARRLVSSGFSEEAGFANWVLALSIKELGPGWYAYLDAYLERFNNWATTDDFCANVLQPLLWKYPAQTLELLRRWNSSPNLWKRRASVVAFTRKVGASGQFINAALELCENLLWDPEDLVQKGVGWALKDGMRGAREGVLAYVKDLRRRGAPATITLYAIRDLKGAERQVVLAIKPGDL